MLEELKGLGERREAAVKAFEAEAQKLVKPALQDFMKQHPSVKALGWAQYTPYFNDGDECVFHLHGMHASASDERDDSLYGDGWTEIYGEPEEGFTKEDWAALKELEGGLNKLEDELKACFGDHVQVIVTADGVVVEEHEHD